MSVSEKTRLPIGPFANNYGANQVRGKAQPTLPINALQLLMGFDQAHQPPADPDTLYTVIETDGKGGADKGYKASKLPAKQNNLFHRSMRVLKDVLELRWDDAASRTPLDQRMQQAKKRIMEQVGVESQGRTYLEPLQGRVRADGSIATKIVIQVVESTNLCKVEKILVYDVDHRTSQEYPVNSGSLRTVCNELCL
jgi:hypothetical protein